MKSKYIVLGALLSLALLSCNKDEGDNMGQGQAYSVRLSGGLGGDYAAESTKSLRVLSSLGDYNQLATLENGNFSFTLPSRQKQSLFFIANERRDLSNLDPKAINSEELYTSDYFTNNGMDEPLLFFAQYEMQKQAQDGGAISLPLQLTPVYARLSFEIDDPMASNRTVEKVEILNVPMYFSLSSVMTHFYYHTKTIPPYINFTLPATQRECFLPEHDPALIRFRTTIKLTMSDGNIFHAVVKDPYSSVDDGKIIRAKFYKLHIKLPMSPLPS